MCSLEKRGNVYLLTLLGEVDHCLNPELMDSILSALRTLKAEPTSPCSALITTAQGKFFCKGFDRAWVQSVPRFKLLFTKLKNLVLEFLSLPMPTIAAVTGHTVTAGVGLVLSHDCVLMRKDRGFLYLAETDIGIAIPNWFMDFLKLKITDAKVRQEFIIMAEKLTADMALERGIVHSAYDSAEETVEAAVRLGGELAKRGWDGYVYANTRKELFRDLIEKNVLDEAIEEKINRFLTLSRL